MESSTNISTNANNPDESVSFSGVTNVVSEWTFDFYFLSLCRLFKEDKLDEFKKTLVTFEAISLSPSLKRKLHEEKTFICGFLSRVIHGKQLDVEFDDDDDDDGNCKIPLVSAAKIWFVLEHSVADKRLFKDIAILLIIQSVAVCLEKGNRSSASSALKWFNNNYEMSQNLGVKLSKIVAEMETYHPFLVSFSFSRLRETVQTFLDSYLEKNPSDYLLKEATKMLQSSQDMESSEDMKTRDSSLPEAVSTPAQDAEEKGKSLRTKRKLMSTKIPDAWKPDTCKKSFVSLQRVPESVCDQKLKRLQYAPVKDICQENLSKSTDEKGSQKRKAPEKWTKELDKFLKAGVRHYGVGKWSLILLDYDFKGRTAVMLKDRWRVLCRNYQVD